MKLNQSVSDICRKAIRLSNNSLKTLDDFNVGMKAVLENPESVEWIDLSFNDLAKIEDVRIASNITW